MNKFDYKEDCQKTADKRLVPRDFQCQACVVLQRDNQDLRNDMRRVLQQYRAERSLNKSLIEQIEGQRELVRLFQLKTVEQENTKQQLMSQYERLVKQQQVLFLDQKKRLQQFWVDNLKQAKGAQGFKARNAQQLDLLSSQIHKLQQQLKGKRKENEICKQQLQRIIASHRLNSEQELLHLDKLNGILSSINSNQNNLMKSLKTVDLKYRQQKKRRKNLMQVLHSAKQDLDKQKLAANEKSLLILKLQEDNRRLINSLADCQERLKLNQQKVLQLQRQVTTSQSTKLQLAKLEDQFKEVCNSEKHYQSLVNLLQHQASQLKSRIAVQQVQKANYKLSNQNYLRQINGQQKLIETLKKDHSALQQSAREQALLMDQLKQQLIELNKELTFREESFIQLLQKRRAQY